MTASLRGQRWIITGAASGIGMETARLFAAQGAHLALWDHSAVVLDEFAAHLRAEPVAVDVTDSHAVDQAMERSLAALGGLDGIVHAAGILRAGAFEQVDMVAHRRTIEVNLIGTLQVVASSLPHLRTSQGRLLMIASVSAFSGAPEYTSYAASKAGVLSFAQALRVELRGTGVSVGVICPLFVRTPMLVGYNGATRLIRSRSPFFDTRSPAEVARIILRAALSRGFLVFVGWRPRLLYWMTRYLDALVYPITVFTYRQGNR